MDMRIPGGIRGFTLLEVLAAFLIVSMSLGIILRIQAQGFAATMLGGGYARAVVLAESMLARSGVESALQNGASSGETPDGYRWSVTVADFQVEDAGTPGSPLPLKEVTVEVTWGDPVKGRSVHLRTLKPVQES